MSKIIQLTSAKFLKMGKKALAENNLSKAAKYFNKAIEGATYLVDKEAYQEAQIQLSKTYTLLGENRLVERILNSRALFFGFDKRLYFDFFENSLTNMNIKRMEYYFSFLNEDDLRNGTKELYNNTDLDHITSFSEFFSLEMKRVKEINQKHEEIQNADYISVKRDMDTGESDIEFKLAKTKENLPIFKVHRNKKIQAKGLEVLYTIRDLIDNRQFKKIVKIYREIDFTGIPQRIHEAILRNVLFASFALNDINFSLEIIKEIEDMGVNVLEYSIMKLTILEELKEQEALDIEFEKIINKTKDSKVIQLNLQQMAINMKKYKYAEMCLDNLERISNVQREDLMLNKAAVNYKLGKVDEAKKIINKAASIYGIYSFSYTIKHCLAINPKLQTIPFYNQNWAATHKTIKDYILTIEKMEAAEFTNEIVNHYDRFTSLLMAISQEKRYAEFLANSKVFAKLLYPRHWLREYRPLMKARTLGILGTILCATGVPLQLKAFLGTKLLNIGEELYNVNNLLTVITVRKIRGLKVPRVLKYAANEALAIASLIVADLQKVYKAINKFIKDYLNAELEVNDKNLLVLVILKHYLKLENYNEFDQKEYNKIIKALHKTK